MIDAPLLQAELDRLGIGIGEAQRSRLLHYMAALERWDRAINLTSLKGPDLVRRLVAEPLWIANQLQLSGNLADIGSGNGSPAIPFCIAGGVRQVHLVESRSRRSAFLRQMVMELGLERVTIHNERVEDVEPGRLPHLEWITLQAVRPEKTLIEALRPFLSSTTTIVWITSIDKPPVPAARKVAVPKSRTLVWLFQ